MNAVKLERVISLHRNWLINGCDGKRANLSHAYLSEANLSHANLSHAYLSHANLCNSGLIIYQTDSWTAYIQIEAIRIGCQYHSVSKWISFTDEEIMEMHPNALESWRKNKEIILKIAESLAPINGENNGK